MQFSLGDIQRFAEWSGDRNPLHVDPKFARRTYFGEPIAHGMLSAIDALACLGGAWSDAPFTLDIEFKGAVRPDVAYDVECAEDGEGWRVAVRSPDAPVLAIRVERAGDVSPSDMSWINTALGGVTSGRHRHATERSDDELATKLELCSTYATADVPTEYLGVRTSSSPSKIRARVLGLCSYLVGMEVPGLKSLFTRASLRFADPTSDCTTLVYRARTTRFDRAFRMLETQVDVATPEGRIVAAGTLRSYVRFGPAVANPVELAARLSAPARDLKGSVALVVGGTRGLGADVTTVLAAAGCHVYASFHRDRGAAVELEHRLVERGLRLTLLEGDAGDAGWCRSAIEQICHESGRLDVLVLNACAAPAVLRAGPSTAERSSTYIAENLRLVQSPLAACVPALHESGGMVAYMSSSFVEEPPAGFGPYVAVKQAGEGLVRAAVRESGALDALIVRPPRLQTSWNDTPTGAPGTIPADWVASHVVNHLAECRGSRRVQLLTEFVPFAPGRAKGGKETDPRPAFTVAVASSFTIDPIVPALRFWLRELEIAGEIEVAPYGQVVQSLLDPTSVFTSPHRGVNVVLLRVGDWIRELLSQDDVALHVQRAASDFERAMRAHRARGSNPTVLMFCPSGAVSPELDPLLARTEHDLIAALNGLSGLQVVQASAFHDRYAVSEQDVHDPLRDRIGHIPYRDSYFHVLATVVVRHAYRGVAPLRKVVVVDADNTLWQGVVGEVGAGAVAFDAGHRALHRTLVRLAQSGVLIAICSKNDESDVWDVFDSRPEMALRREHIVGAAINWQSKSQNLRALASKLNLGLDSFVFIDDNPVECAEVRAHCPEVLTLEWPQDAVAAIGLVNHTWELDVVDGTAEDRRRTEMYREELQRQELREGTLTLREFLESLDLRVEIAPLGPDDVRRASQLTLRTNQFNFTTRRRDEPEMQRLASSGRHDIRTVRVRDRFGDYGLVGLMVAEWRDDVLDVDTFLLSCRVLGRGVEHRMAAELGMIAQTRGLDAVSWRVDFTKKNEPARQFLRTIAAAGQLVSTDTSLECRMSSGDLAGLRFEPSDDSGAAPEAEDERPTASVLRPSASLAEGSPALNKTGYFRSREAQIQRAASDLSTAQGLAKAVVGRALSGSPGEPERFAPQVNNRDDTVRTNDIAQTVYGAFANALRMAAAKVKEHDRLEALGCDSLKIVEITVELIDAFPWIPPTLLFEHRTVSEIVRAIAALRDSELGSQAPPSEHSAAVGYKDSSAGRPVTGRQVESTDIAVVGMHVRCAGANSPAELWDLLSSGRSAVAAVPVLRRYFLHSLVDTRDHWAGLLDEPGRFDAEFFGVSPREAEYMDPQLRLFLEVAWGALEDAGCAGAEHDPETGVFAGVMYGDYGTRANLGPAASTYRCWEGFSLANRLSQLLGFSGPSLAVDTACSSSGTALHLACASLRARECRVAVVGGVNLILDPDRFASLGRLGILSIRGKCEPFGADADGTVLGEGAGVVVLRPLADALRRSDRIYGVIKGTGLSTGSGTVGFTAPNPQAQAEAIRRGLQAARIDPRTISYVETHGTGTALGDPIEVRGLTLAYSNRDLHDTTLRIDHRCTLGSIKPNIGHLEAGAGVLGLIKVLLQLQHRMLLPSITSSQPNPQIPFAQSAFDVQRQLAEWRPPVAEIDGKSMAVPRRAGLSSFGVGGANAHVIVEEPPPGTLRAAPIERPLHLLAISARTEGSLQQYAARMRECVDQTSDVALSDVCFSAASGRRHFEHRVAISVATLDGLREALHAVSNGTDPKTGARGVVSSGSTPRIAFLFTGQGSQYAGMGRQLYDTHPVFRDAIDRCAAVLDTRLSRPLRDVLFAADGSADAELINQTAYTQPALFAVEYAMSRLWQSWGITPDYVLGHSIGEIAAMCVAGGLSLEDGLKLVEARGRLMQALPSGGVMTSVMADEAAVREAIAGFEESVAIAAINAPGQVVISGAGAAVAEIDARLNGRGIKTKALTVSHAFHSPLMKPMLAEYERIVRDVSFHRATVKFVSGVSGGVLGDEITQTQYWLRNVTDPVRFATAMKVLEAERVDVCIEVGPHPVLLGLARQSVTDDSTVEWLPSLRRDTDAWQTVLGSVARSYVRGANIDWKGFDAAYPRKRVAVPAYAFAGREYWLKNLPLPTAAAEPGAHTPAEVGGESHEPALYELAWRKTSEAAPQAAEEVRATVSQDHWIVLADHRGVGAQLIDALHRQGVTTTLVTAGRGFQATGTRSYTIDPANPEHFARLWAAVGGDRKAGPRVVHLWNLDAAANPALNLHALDDAVERGVSTVIYMVQALARAGVSHRALWVVTQGAARDLTSDPVARTSTIRQETAVAQAPVWGLGRTIALEHPDVWGGLIDIPHEDPPLAARLLARELTGVVRLPETTRVRLKPDTTYEVPDTTYEVSTYEATDEDQVALTENGRYVARFVRRGSTLTAQVDEPKLRSDVTYLVTGGVGALGLRVARWLVDGGARHLLLTSRHAILDDSVRAAIVPLERAGAAVSVVAADVSKPDDVDALLARIAAGPAPLGGIIHAAGVDTTMPVVKMTAHDLEAALAAKVKGGWLLHDRTRGLRLDLFVCFSSLASVLGSQGRAHYAAANAFLDALVLERRRLELNATSINWGPWSGGGMASVEQLQQFERVGNYGLEPDDALEALAVIVRSRRAHLAYADIDWATFRPAYEARRRRPLLSEVGRVLLDPPAVGSDVARMPRPSASIGRGSAKTEWLTTLEALEAPLREPELARLLQREVADTLGFDDPASIAPDRNFYEIGMDSLMMADLVGRLKKRIGISCSALVFDHPDVRSLASKLIDRLPLDITASDVGRGPHPAVNIGRGPAEHEVAIQDRLPSLRTERGPAEAVAVLEASPENVGRVPLPESVRGPAVNGYDPAVEPEIFAFQAEAWPHRSPDLIPARWRWMFVESARRLARAPLVWLYRDAGAIVGHMGSIPVRVKIGEEEYDTGWLVDTMVLPAYRNQAVGSRLMVDAHDQQPFSLSLGQTAEMREIQFRLGWKQVAALQTAQLLVRPANVLKGKLPRPAAYAASLGLWASAGVRGWRGERREYKANPVDRFGDLHSTLWMTMSRDVTCAVVRDASYLNWKYVDQPGQQFLRLELRDGNDLKGVAVWLVREADHVYQYRRAFLVDLVASLSDSASLRHVIKAACNAATAAGADALLCHHIDARLTDALRDSGFFLRKPERFLLVDPGPLSERTREHALSPAHWFVTQGDSDIDRPW